MLVEDYSRYSVMSLYIYQALDEGLRTSFTSVYLGDLAQVTLILWTLVSAPDNIKVWSRCAVTVFLKIYAVIFS